MDIADDMENNQGIKKDRQLERIADGLF